MRRYRIGREFGDLQPAAGQKPKERERERDRGKPKIRNLRRYLIGGYFGTSGRQPAKREGKKERGKPKIRNLRRYRIGEDLGTSSRQPAKSQRKERERKTKNQKFEALYNRRVPEGPPASSRPKEKRQGKPKIRNSRRYRIGGYFGDLQPRPKDKGKRERGKPKIRNLRRYRIGGYFRAAGSQAKKEKEKWEAAAHRPILRIGLLGNPRGIQIGVTRRTGHLKGGAETPGCMRLWLLGGQGSTEPRCQ